MRVNDLDQAETWAATGGPLLPGRHDVDITEVKEGTSSGGYPQIEMLFSSPTGAGSCRDWLVVIPSTYGKVKQLLEATGVPIPQGDAELDVNKLLNKKLTVTVKERLDNRGEKRNDVVAYEPAGRGTGAAPPAASDVDSSTAGFTAGKVVDDSDIPF